MQKEYIEREALEKQLNERLKNLRKENGYYDHYTDGYDEAVDTVENAPSADVAPVVHGEWQMGESGCMFFCSECELWVFPRESRVWNYCPICGAKMDGGNRNADA